MKKIEFLFPELTIYGDSFNIEYLKKCNNEIEVIATSLKEEPAFLKEKVDMIYLGSLTESGQVAAINKLLPHKKKIQNLIKKDVIFLVTGSAMEIFGKSILRNNEELQGLSIFEYSTKYNYESRYHDLFYGTFEDIKILGFKAQHSFIYDVKEEELFHKIKGIGNSPLDEKEGIRCHNFMATKLLGPLFIYTPLFAKKILLLLGLSDRLAFEEDILEAYDKKLEDFEETLFQK